MVRRKKKMEGKMMIVKVLGTCSPYSNQKEKNGPGFLVYLSSGEKILLDAGSGIHRLLNIPVELANLHVFISHYHKDHWSDIGNIQYASYVHHKFRNLLEPIQIYLPELGNNELEIFRLSKLVIEEEPLSYQEIHQVCENSIFKIGDAIVTFLKTTHPTCTFASKIEYEGKRIVYSADTGVQSFDDLVNFAKDCDLLICESTYLDIQKHSDNHSHLSSKEAALIAKKANVKTLLLTYFSPINPTECSLMEAKIIFERTKIATEENVIYV